MPGRYTSYPVYSGGQYPQQLYSYPQYAAPYGWGYPQYAHPQYPGVPLGNPYQGYPLSPRQGKKERRTVTPFEETQLNELLGGRYRPTAVWDISYPIDNARHIHGRGAPEIIPESLLNKPATEPPVHRMRIISDDFPWDINIEIPRNEIVTVRHVFAAIHGILREPLDKEDWDMETPNGKKNLHKSRCARLAGRMASFKVDSHIQKLDLLGDKTFFMGLRPVGSAVSAEQPEVWLLKVGPVPRHGR